MVKFIEQSYSKHLRNEIGPTIRSRKIWQHQDPSITLDDLNFSGTYKSLSKMS